MASKHCDEKSRSMNKSNSQDSLRATHALIILCQHLLLWSSLYVAGGTSYILSRGRLNTEIVVAESLLIAAATASMLYLISHHSAVLLRSSKEGLKRRDNRSRWDRLPIHCLRLSVMIWLASSALSIVFILARHPGCSARGQPATSLLDFGSTCIVQRAVIGASLLALLLSCILFILTHRIREPLRCHLFGVTAEPRDLPLTLPYKLSIDRPMNPMFSDMSFKCRSSTTLSSTLSSTTLVRGVDESTASLLPRQPEKTVGLGIYTSRSSMPSFLAPRPSLSSIKTHASVHLPSSPSLPPPLPAHLPQNYNVGSAMHKAIHPPQRPPRSPRRPSEHTVRVVPPSPALSIANLATVNKSTESLSSVYSRSISGEQPSPVTVQRPGALTEESRTASSSSTVTVKRSPLGNMQLASDSDVPVGAQSQVPCSSSCSSSDSGIDDAATLQARLPIVRMVSEFGEVSHWPALTEAGNGDVAAKCREISYNDCLGGMRKADLTRLNVTRMRDSAGMFCVGAIGVAT